MNEALAKRYASALADVALGQGSADQVKRDLDSFVEAFHTSADLRNFLESPSVGRDLKAKVIGKLAAEMKLSGAVHNLISLIVDNRRTQSLREIGVAFAEELNARLGIAQADVTSARGLSDEQRRQVTAALERRTGKKIEARFHEDRSLLGGAVVRVGSTVFDGSVREQLARLRERLEAE